MSDITEFLKASEEYAEKADIKLSRLGILVANDGKFFKRIRATGRLSVDKREMALKFYKDVEPGSWRKQKRKSKPEGNTTCHRQATTSPQAIAET